MGNPLTLETVSGRSIDPSDPDVNTIDINDIAWSLSRTSRFGGHTTTEIPYNVASHSVFVADMVGEATDNVELSMFALLHDAAEYAIGDIPSPVKKIPALAKVIGPIEAMILDQIYLKYVGRLPIEDELKTIKFYDKKAQFIEAWNFMATRGLNWWDRAQYEITLIDIQQAPKPIPSIEAYQQFMVAFNTLKDSL